MKKPTLLLLLYLAVNLVIAQNFDNSYYQEFNGEYMGEGGSEIIIKFKTTYFLISVGEMGEVSQTFKGYPSNGKIKYKTGNNSFEYIKWDSDKKNCIRQGQYEWFFCNAQKNIKQKVRKLSIKDLSVINQYVGEWEGKSYEDKNIVYKAKITLEDDGIIFNNINDNKKCVLVLQNSNKLTGEIYFSKWDEILPFTLYLNNGTLVLDDYNQYSITYSKK